MDGGDVIPADKKTFTEIFEENCSYYMFLGMSYNDYWHGDPEMVKYYRDKHILENKARNEEMWIQGMYFIRSIQVALDSKQKAKYYEKPLDIYPKTEQEKEREKEIQRQKVINYFNELKQRWDNGNNRQPDT